MSTRTYAQFCPVAVSLDVLGDRWTLLILRDLSFGPQRFSDLRRSLDGIAPNLLSDRLRELEANGLVGREELPPPAARSVYVLSEAGKKVRPVLTALLRFGLDRLPEDPDAVVLPRVAAAALLSRFDASASAELDLQLALVIDGEHFLRHLGPGQITRGERTRRPDVTVEGAAGAVLDLARGRIGWVAASRVGALHVSGSAIAKRQVVAALRLAKGHRSSVTAST